MSKSYAKHGSCFVVLLNSNNEVLTIQRSTAVKWPGRWALPGGRLEPGETVLEGGLRELREETGILIDRPAQHGHLIVRSGDTHLAFLPWVPSPSQRTLVEGLVVGSSQPSTEVDACRWRTWTEINSMLELHKSLDLLTYKWRDNLYGLLEHRRII